MRISFREYVFPFGDNSVWLLKQFFVLSFFFSSSLLKIFYVQFICTNYFSAGFIFHLFQVIYVAVFLCRNGYAGSSRMKMYFDPFQPTVQFHAQFQIRKRAQSFFLCYHFIIAYWKFNSFTLYAISQFSYIANFNIYVIYNLERYTPFCVSYEV